MLQCCSVAITAVKASYSKQVRIQKYKNKLLFLWSNKDCAKKSCWQFYHFSHSAPTEPHESSPASTRLIKFVDDSKVFRKQRQIWLHERSPTYIHLTQVVNVSCLLNQVVRLSLDRQRHTGALIAFNAHHTLNATFDIFEILHCLQHRIKVPVNQKFSSLLGTCHWVLPFLKEQQNWTW